MEIDHFPKERVLRDRQGIQGGGREGEETWNVLSRYNNTPHEDCYVLLLLYS